MGGRLSGNVVRQEDCADTMSNTMSKRLYYILKAMKKQWIFLRLKLYIKVIITLKIRFSNV